MVECAAAGFALVVAKYRWCESDLRGVAMNYSEMTSIRILRF